jgi:DNA-binding NarL/FixJ family response regulator
VLELLAAGLSNAKIAARLGLSGRTVEIHVSATLRKLRVRTGKEASAQAERRRGQRSAGLGQHRRR